MIRLLQCENGEFRLIEFANRNIPELHIWRVKTHAVRGCQVNHPWPWTSARSDEWRRWITLARQRSTFSWPSMAFISMRPYWTSPGEGAVKSCLLFHWFDRRRSLKVSRMGPFTQCHVVASIYWDRSMLHPVYVSTSKLNITEVDSALCGRTAPRI
jgi:hypothetical protein